MPLLLAMLWGCKDRPTDPAQATEAACDEDWWSAGQPLLLDFCAGCHSSRLSGDARFGAPGGVDFETLDGALQHTDRIRARVLEAGDMPPGGGMSAAQLDRLAAWLDCADQSASPLPSVSSTLPQTTPLDFVLTVEEADGWLVVSRTDFSDQPWSEEYYLSIGDNVWFGGYTLYDKALFDVARAVLFEPLLPMTSSSGEESWTETVSAEVTEDGVTASEEQTWAVSLGAPSQLDGRSVDRSPTELVMVSDEGEVHAWHLSETRILSGRWIATNTRIVESLRSDHYSPDVSAPDEPFPFEDGDSWTEKAILIEGETW